MKTHEKLKDDVWRQFKCIESRCQKSIDKCTYWTKTHLSFHTYIVLHGVIVFDTPWRWGYYHQSLTRIMTSETDEVLMLIYSLYMLLSSWRQKTGWTLKDISCFLRIFSHNWVWICHESKISSGGFPSLLGIKTGRWLIHSLKQSKMVRKMQNIG